MILKRVMLCLAVGLAVVMCSTVALGPNCALAEKAADDTSHDSPADGGHGAAGGGSPSDFKADLALWTGVVFLVLMAVLWKFAWGPIAQGLELRESGIAGQIAEAEQANLQAKDLLVQYEKKLAASKDEVRAMLDKGKQDAEKAGRQLIEKARRDAEAEHEKALQQIDVATTGALKELADQSASLAVDLAGKIVRAELKPGDHSKLIEQAVNGLTRQTPSNN